MAKRHPNYRQVNIHRNYTVEETANLFCIHKNTVREWVKTGLPTSDDKRPMLILGRDLATFLQARRANKKRPSRPGEIYCVRCRTAKVPAGDMADYRPITEKTGNLEAICPDCTSMMYRCVSLAKLSLVQGKMVIRFPQALRRVNESNQPTVNSDLR